MGSAAEILVIILSAALAIFLALVIVLAILLIRITKQIKSIANSAERTVQSVENATSKFNKLATPAILLNVASMIAKKTVKMSKSHKAKETENVKRK